MIYIVVYCRRITNQLNLNKMETIKATEFTQAATVITLDFIPTVQEQNELFGSDESIILEF